MESKWLYRATFWQMGEWFIKSLDIFILIFALATSSIERWSTYVIVIIFCVLWIYLNFYKKEKKKMELLYFLDKNRHVVTIKDLEYFIYRARACLAISDITSALMVTLSNPEPLPRVVSILVENLNIKAVAPFVPENRRYKFGHNTISLIMYCFWLKKHIMMWLILDISFKSPKKSFHW